MIQGGSKEGNEGGGTKVPSEWLHVPFGSVVALCGTMPAPKFQFFQCPPPPRLNIPVQPWVTLPELSSSDASVQLDMTSSSDVKEDASRDDANVTRNEDPSQLIDHLS